MYNYLRFVIDAWMGTPILLIKLISFYLKQWCFRKIIGISCVCVPTVTLSYITWFCMPSLFRFQTSRSVFLFIADKMEPELRSVLELAQVTEQVKNIQSLSKTNTLLLKFQPRMYSLGLLLN